MKILILVDCYLPSVKSSAKLVHSLASELLAQGHQPIVVAPDDSLTSCRQISNEDGFAVLRVRTGRIKGASKIVRAVNEWRLSPVIWKVGKDFFVANPCDLIVYYSPTIFFGVLVARLKKLWSCRSLLILRDIFPQWAVDAGVIRRGSMPWRFFRRKELQQYDAADVICVQSPANLKYFRDQGLTGRYHLEVLYNWTPTEGEVVPRTDFRRRLGLEGKVVFFYGGNIGVAQDMDNIVRLAEGLVDRKDLFFLVVGEGSEVSRLLELIARKGLTNIRILPAVDQQTYLGLVSEFDVGLISLDKGLQTQNFPGKMLGYMYFGMPTLASINPGNDLRTVLEADQAGLVCLNGEDDQLREFAVALGSDAELRRRIGQNGRRLVERLFSVRQAAAQIVNHAEKNPAGGSADDRLSRPVRPDARCAGHDGGFANRDRPRTRRDFHA